MSASGKGAHTWVYADVGKGRKAKGMEIYSTERFIICTGNAISKIEYTNNAGVITPTVLNNIVLPVQEKNAFANTIADSLTGASATPTIALTEIDSIETDAVLWQRASTADNAAKFIGLCNGEWQGLYPSQSEADISLMSMFTFYSKSNEQCRRMFRQTGLGQRDKAIKNDTYLNRTLRLIRNRIANEVQVEFSCTLASETESNISNKKTLSVRSDQDLLNMPLMLWLVKNLLPTVGFAAIYGPSGSGKSFLALYLLWCIANGKSFFGHNCKQADAAYVYFEGGGGFPQRVKALTQHYGSAPIKYIDAQGFNLTEDIDRQELVNTLSEHLAKGCVVCIDTLAASAAGMDENSSQEMTLLISQLHSVQKVIGGLVLVVHHTGKDQDKGLRGSSALIGALDASILVRRYIKEKRRSWSAEKLKDAADGDMENDFTLQATFLQYDEDNEPVYSAVVQPNAKINSKARVDQDKLAADIDKYIFDWITDLLMEGNLPSENSINKQKKIMKPKFLPKAKELTQAQIRDSVSRLKLEKKSYKKVLVTKLIYRQSPAR